MKGLSNVEELNKKVLTYFVDQLRLRVKKINQESLRL